MLCEDNSLQTLPLQDKSGSDHANTAPGSDSPSRVVLNRQRNPSRPALSSPPHQGWLLHLHLESSLFSLVSTTETELTFLSFHYCIALLFYVNVPSFCISEFATHDIITSTCAARMMECPPSEQFGLNSNYRPSAAWEHLLLLPSLLSRTPIKC